MMQSSPSPLDPQNQETPEQRSVRHAQERKNNYAVAKDFAKHKEDMPVLDKIIFRRLYETLESGMHPDEKMGYVFARLHEIVAGVCKENAATDEASAGVVEELRKDARRQARLASEGKQGFFADIDATLRQSLFINYVFVKRGIAVTNSQYAIASNPETTLGQFAAIMQKGQRVSRRRPESDGDSSLRAHG